MTDAARYYANVWEDGVFPVVLEADPNGDYRDDSCIQVPEELVRRYEDAARAYRDINIELMTLMGNDYMARQWDRFEVVHRD